MTKCRVIIGESRRNSQRVERLIKNGNERGSICSQKGCSFTCLASINNTNESNGDNRNVVAFCR